MRLRVGDPQLPSCVLLAIDVGSSSVKAAVLDGTAIVGAVASAAFLTDFATDRAEVPADRIDAAVRAAVSQLDFDGIAAVGLTGMGPAWLAMADDGTAITPVVTHQDRRSLAQAERIEATIGRERHLATAGNRPTPGGISSTTAAWFAENTDALSRAGKVGHLPTYLMRRLAGVWAIDPSNAGFSGLMDVATGDWSNELCNAVGVARDKLPPIVDAATVVGETITNDLGVPVSLPMFGGYVDGSGPLLLGGATVGTLCHSAGSTDVLAACVDRPTPREGLLCRPLGTRGLWVSAATQAAGAAGLAWARRVLYAEADDAAFAAAVELAGGLARRVGSDAQTRRASPPANAPTFRPHLAGDRQQVRQPTAGLDDLTLAHTRDDLLAAVLRALVADHRDRLDRLLAVAGDVQRSVISTGGGDLLARHCHAAWPDTGSWTFREVDQATLRGLGSINPAAATASPVAAAASAPSATAPAP